MDEARLKEIERVCTERGCQPGRDQCREVCDEVRRLRGREDAVFAKGYRAGFFDGSQSGTSPFQDEVDLAHAAWVDRGRKTHLEEFA